MTLNLKSSTHEEACPGVTRPWSKAESSTHGKACSRRSCNMFPEPRSLVCTPSFTRKMFCSLINLFTRKTCSRKMLPEQICFLLPRINSKIAHEGALLLWTPQLARTDPGFSSGRCEGRGALHKNCNKGDLK